MAVLLLAEVLSGDVSIDQTAKALTAAKKLGDVTVLCASNNCKLASEEVAKLDGVSKVLCVEDESYGNGLAEPIADLILSISANYEHIVAPATALAKNILPRVSALLDVMIISDITGIIDGGTFERPIYAGNAIQTVKSSDNKKVLSIRTAGFDASSEGGSATIETLSSVADPNLSIWVEDKVQASDRPELTSAKIVVSGGRGVGSQESFNIIEAMADKLNAAVGASRAAVDAGYIVVAPDLYIACGISGAIQHLAGMKDSKVIVAINKDEEAPIFQVADYGLVADLFDAVPELTEAL